MDSLPISPVDLGVIVLLLISGLLAFSRGLVHEVLAVAGWIGAALAVLFLLPYVSPYLRENIANIWLADGIGAVGIFIVALMVFSLIAHRIAGAVQDSALGPVDRTLGFVFGLVRGAAIVCVAYLIYAWMVPPADFPSWLREARALPLAQAGGAALLDLVPGAQDVAPHLRQPPELRIGVEDLMPRREPAPRSATAPDAAPQQPQGSAGSTTAPAETRPQQGATDAPVGYDRRSRQALENLIGSEPGDEPAGDAPAGGAEGTERQQAPAN